MTKQPPPPPRWLAVVCFVVPFGAYMLTAARTVQGGDAGEFGLVGMLGGVPHPPGYPLYALFLRVMSFIPIDPPFLRMSLTSAFCGAAATSVVQRIAWRLTGNAWASVATALALGFCGILWRLSGVPEAFAPHALMVSLVVLMTLRLADAAPPDVPRESLLLGLCFGLGMSNHQTIVTCGPMALAAIVAIGRRMGLSVALKATGLTTVAGIAGLTPYLLLLSWGRLDHSRAWVWGQTTTIPGLVSHFMREQYGTFRLSASRTGSPDQRWHWLAAMAKTLFRQYDYILAVIGLGGIVIAFRRRPVWTIGSTASLLLGAVVFPAVMTFRRSEVTAEIADRFFLMPLVLFAPFVAIGIAEIESRRKRIPLRPLLVLMIAGGAFATYPSVNWRRDDGIQRYVSAALKPLPPNAIVLGRSDTVGPAVGWAERVMHIRPDVHYIDVELLPSRWYYDHIAAEIPGFPVRYIPARTNVVDLAVKLSRVAPTFITPWMATIARKSIQIEPAGLLYRVEDKPVQIPIGTWRGMIDRDLTDLGELPMPVDAWSKLARDAVVFVLADLMQAYDAAGMTTERDAINRRIGGFVSPDTDDDVEDPSALADEQ